MTANKLIFFTFASITVDCEYENHKHEDHREEDMYQQPGIKPNINIIY